MEAKKNQDLSNKVDKIIEERNHLRDFKKKIIQDQLINHGDNLRKKLEILTVNDRLVSEKMNKTKQMDMEKKTEQVTYFPFTHGEAI